MKRARHYSPTGDKGYEVDLQKGGPNGDGQSLSPKRGLTKDKTNRKLSCKECHRYVCLRNVRLHFLTISRLKIKVRNSSISFHQVM